MLSTIRLKLKAEDSDMYGASDSNPDTDENTGRYVGKEAFTHYYK